ncbi:unnamed protein product [Ilex paraguariensis]|uniref:Uncharacterized protein n=1 Tax=Ilex paraguariensis TaxID=185542 RepID=A0ABC8RBG7_9AQUA
MVSTVIKIDGQEPNDLLDDLSAQEQTMSTVIKIDGEEPTDLLHDLSAQEQVLITVNILDFGGFLATGKWIAVELPQVDFEDGHHGFCAICLCKIVLQETALVKGCEHAYWFV